LTQAAPEPAVPPRGGVIVRAHRLADALDLDGFLGESVYAEVLPTSGFIQQEPTEGAPATEQTEVWVLFDDENVYVSVRCWDSQPERILATDLRRDNQNISQNDNVAVVFDTFSDGRNGFYFQTNPLGALRDATFTDEGNQNTDWNTVWDVRSQRSEQGWTLEMVIPFKSLRYGGSGPQVWGFNLRRSVGWKNEHSFITTMPAGYARNAIFKVSNAAVMVGIETPEEAMNLEVKPYGISARTTGREAAEALSSHWTADAGIDVKYGLTSGLIADFTYNTDFAQVEADEQQVNLTRFSLQFPEKRDFFLEGRGIFAFGTPSGTGPGGAGDVPVMFFSRRIGLSQGQAVPVKLGARVTGRAGPFTLGALNVQTGAEPGAEAVPTNFTVLRLKRDILSRSSVGLIATRRTPSEADDDPSLTLGVDTSMLFLTYLAVSGYYARTPSDDLAEDDSYRVQIGWGGDRYGLDLDHLRVGEAFDPEVGFARRHDFRRSSAQIRFSPRPTSMPAIRRLVFQASGDYVTDARGERIETREGTGSFRMEMNNTDAWFLDHTRTYELLEEGFSIGKGVEVPAGDYAFGTTRTGYQFGQQRPVSGNVSVAVGSFYGGDRTSANASGRVEVTPRFSFEPSVSINWVDVPGGTFTSRLAATRVIFAPSPRSALSALIQYNSGIESLSSNIRLRWEYAPGSEVFLVDSDGRNTGEWRGLPELEDRTLAVKLTHLLRF
jgi:hypothetical protein